MQSNKIAGKQETVPFLPEDERELSRPSSSRWSKTAWLAFSIGTLLNVVLFLGTAMMYVQIHSDNDKGPGPLQSDIKDAFKAVEYETRAFTGALKYDPETKNLHREQDYSTEYFGPPTEKLDDAWESLLHNEFVPMTDEEAAPFLPELRPLPGKDAAFFEPGIFHSLHCLNALRNLVSKYMYNSTAISEEYSVSEIAHNEHCMDRIRQSLICQGDLTPSPMYWWDGYGTALGRTGAQTCRKWQPIRDWMDERREVEKATA